MVAKNKNRIVVLGIGFVAVALMSSTPMKVEASDIDVYTNSQENLTETEDQTPVVFETTVVDSDYTMSAVVNMTESYDEEYGIYEESIGNEFFIYSTIGNGGISSEPVTIDIPLNVEYTLEKNGRKVKYTSGVPIKGKGHFVLRLTAVSGDTTYRSTFRFTILKAEKKTEDTAPQNTTGPDNVTSITDSDTYFFDTDTYEPDINESNIDEPNIDETDIYEPDIDIEDPPATEISDMDESDTEEAPDEESQPTETSEDLSSVDKYTGFVETYDDATGEYVNTLKSGDVFRTNLPNGIITNGEVVLTIPDTLDYTIYKDDELYETTTLRFTEAGSYRVIMSSDRLDYVLAYGDGKEIVYAFRIIVEAVSDMHIFNAPAGFTLTEVFYEDNEVFAVNGMQGSYFKLTDDGSYIFRYSNAETGASYSTDVELDTQAPEFVIGIKNGVASVTYNSTDIERIDLSKDSVALTEFSAYKITGKGSYELTVTDKSGNISTAAFQLKESINSATIWAVIILAAIISGVVAIVRVNQKKVIVR